MTESVTAAVSAREVRKSFGAHHVLAGVDLDVPAGTISAVLGPSGCGKTTLLRILAGFEEPDAGTVRIADRMVAGGAAPVPVHRRRVGLMPQEGALFPHLSVGQNIAFGITGHRRDQLRGRIEHWLDVVGLQGRADARPHELSGGQQQRVALARALAAAPRVLLLDEPFAALDAGLRVRVREDIAAILRDTGTTAILVTHDQAEALSLADSVALLIDGTVAQHGAPTDLYDRPATLTNARFIGATIEIPGTADGQTVHTALGALRARLPIADGPALVVLRPEQLRITADPAGARATVTVLRFYGAETVVQARLSDGATIQLRHAGRQDLRPGDPITVEVADDRGVLAYPSPTSGQRVALGEPGR